VNYSECPVIVCPAVTKESWCDHRPEHVIEVHGGLTYSEKCSDDKEFGICHTPSDNWLCVESCDHAAGIYQCESEDDDVWWFGFDCHHWRDYAPAFEARMNELTKIKPGLKSPTENNIYRPLTYVIEEVTSLAQQLHKV
jgi:hypothetical protein